MREAISWLRDFLGAPSVAMIHPTDASFNQTLDWMQQHNLGRKRILDTHLAAILRTNGVSRLLTSNPSDFKIFGQLEIVSP
jgi:hypothetical protein